MLDKIITRLENAWERTYRKLKGDEVLWSHFPEIEDFITLAKAADAKRILDAGCGDGKNLLALLMEPGFHCVGCDNSPSALRVCEREINRLNEKGMRDSRIQLQISTFACLILTALEDTPFLDDYFDAAICIDVINHNRNPYPILDELSRVVVRDGLIYFSLFNVEDEILTNPDYAQNMKPAKGGVKEREYVYEFINGEGSLEKYYFRFLHIDEIEEFLRPSNLSIIDKKVKLWENPPHPNFRPYKHYHCNIMVTAKNRK